MAGWYQLINTMSDQIPEDSEGKGAQRIAVHGITRVDLNGATEQESVPSVIAAKHE